MHLFLHPTVSSFCANPKLGFLPNSHFYSNGPRLLDSLICCNKKSVTTFFWPHTDIRSVMSGQITQVNDRSFMQIKDECQPKTRLLSLSPPNLCAPLSPIPISRQKINPGQERQNPKIHQENCALTPEFLNWVDLRLKIGQSIQVKLQKKKNTIFAYLDLWFKKLTFLSLFGNKYWGKKTHSQGFLVKILRLVIGPLFNNNNKNGIMFP